MQEKVEFTEENIQKLFGHEAAEDEDPERLREYYFKTTVYNQMISDAPVRVLVGHKGIGKSALFQVSMQDDKDNKKLAILIQPNDIAKLATGTSTDFLLTIMSWTHGLNEIVAKKVFEIIGERNRSLLERLEIYDGRVLDFLHDVMKEYRETNTAINRTLVDSFLKNPKISVYIDDLDRGWQGKKNDVTRISALINAIRDISSRNRGLNFKIALRSDVYYLVRTSDESTDKVEGSVIWLTWSNHEIFVLLIKRIETFFGRSVDTNALLQKPQRELSSYLFSIMEERFTGKGHWENAPMYRVLMSLIRKRPRDLVKLCTLAARKAYTRKSHLIQTVDFASIFEEYSQGRIQDTINEYRSELPLIEILLMNMKPAKKEREAKKGYVYKTSGLLAKINHISSMSRFQFADGKDANSQTLAAFLYKINFLTARKEMSSGIIRKYFEENRYLSSGFVDFGFDWEIHPAYRWALQPSTIEDIFYNLQLSEDDD